MAPPVVAAVEAVRADGRAARPADRPDARRGGGSTRPGSRELAPEPRLVLLCGRYEGFDERIIEILEPELLSIGDYVLSAARSRRWS